MNTKTFVIAGASLAGASAAGELRERGFDGRVLLIGDEPELPYERPPLSKDYLQGEAEREKARVHPEGFYAEHEIELHTMTAVTELNTDQRTLTLVHSDTLDEVGSVSYDALLLSTGAEPRTLDVPGADLGEVYYLRTLSDCDLLRERFVRGGRAVIVGSGWIGSEVAASARKAGLEVTVVDSVSLPNERLFGPEIGEFYRDVHISHGVEMKLGAGVQEFLGGDDGNVRAVKLSSGVTVDGDFVVVGVGAAPRVGLATGAGLEIDNGITVTDGLQTSAAGVFAAGDVANAWHPFYERQIRVEHWANALNQAPAAARAMVGDKVSYDRLPYFFSDQYDVGMEYSGYASEWDEVVFRGDREDGEFVAFWLAGGRVIAGMNVNVWDVNEHVQAIIRSRRQIDPELLRDANTPLESLVAD
jgi:3-phenylpropionate/trans-cinnamate dioxygenase ferredoxin reductase subunit